MYSYNYRIFDRYDRPVVSLALLADDNPAWRPDSYGYEFWGCRALLEFPVFKLMDMAEQLSTLEECKNPFAVCTLAHFKAMEIAHSPVDRKKWKYNLTIGLYKRGYSREDIIKLFSFIDWIMSLPDELEANFLEKIYRYEEECKMPYVTSAERKGIQKGLQQGGIASGGA